ncbi:hypothetical protein K439DRAFT_1618064 [Ramaria rubella]|nr:hypothetical protein K439DRAFT_1618064 [Ramaria rubella]
MQHAIIKRAVHKQHLATQTPVFEIAHDTPPNLRDTLRMIEYSPEGVSPVICGLIDNTLQLEDVDVWVWLKLIKPKKDSLVFLQKVTELFTVCGQWANLAEMSLDELAQWLGIYVGVDTARALVNIEPNFVCKQRKVWYNKTAQRVLDTCEGRKYTGLHIPTPAQGFGDHLAHGQGGGPPCLQARTNVLSTGSPAPSTPLPASTHIVEDNPMEVDPADTLYYDNSVKVAVQSSLTAPVPIYADPLSAQHCPNLPEVWSVGRM